jgi:proteasome lid subunit RPN8/RPN11
MAAFYTLSVSPDLQDAAGTLALQRAVLAEMLAHVEADYPNEGCGALAGADGRVTQHFPAANASDTPRTFSEIGSQELLAIWNTIESHGWDMLAYYHSHPASPAYPSPRDVLWSQNWPGTYYIIFSLANRAHPVVRAFLIEGETIHEHRIQVTG